MKYKIIFFFFLASCTHYSSSINSKSGYFSSGFVYIEEQKPIRYASEEESEHLSTLEADTEDDCSSICDSDDNNGEASQDDEDKYSNNDKAWKEKLGTHK